MNRPASVITTLILFGLFILIGLFTIVRNFQPNIVVLLSGAIMPSLFTIGWLGVFFKKNWARIYSTVLIMLFGLLMLLLPFINKASQGPATEQVVLLLLMFAFMAWWAYSLYAGKASKSYFQGKQPKKNETKQT